MLYLILPLRDKGCALPRWRTCMPSAIRADVLIADETDPAWHRSTRVARLYDPDSRKPLAHPSPLYDVTIISASGDYLVLAGLERTRDDLLDREIAYAQSWLLTLPR